ncbi:glycosyltransferase family 1 protein [Uliginosibacterium paludis]|uniref:Glycosyltransferase family 1 protein n=1 Tax=Uliginosibacterium paludis TaxID=1615952 RepID=A0ABV2CMS5_9RHOO
MQGNFSLPAGLVGRFAIVKLWPELKTAEDECIARISLAAKQLGIECIEIGPDGKWISDPSLNVSQGNVDFVIHLHYDTPKNYDAFSFVALWNPLRFYFEWGYERCSRNLTTHDDFISCGSEAADDHVYRMVRGEKTHLAPKFRVYHSTPGIVHLPTLGDQKLFYAGINWEAVSGGKSRHQEVLKRLDKTGNLRIYGPQMFHGIKVWAGYQSYVKEIPFDGISMIHEIAKAGIALVLSSPAHKKSGLMSTRLFESISAGAVIICDENPFARKHFGEALLYIDSRSPVDQMLADIERHIEWIKTNPAAAKALAVRAQEIFTQNFTLVKNISDLYLGLSDRRRALDERARGAGGAMGVNVFFLMPEFSRDVLIQHLESSKQTCTDVKPYLVLDSRIYDQNQSEIDQLIRDSGAHIELDIRDYSAAAIYPELRAARPLGEVIFDLIQKTPMDHAFMVVAPNESLQSRHVETLVSALRASRDVVCAATAAVLDQGEEVVRSVHELLDFGHVNKSGPTGYGRFIFRRGAIPEDVGTAIRYLHGRPLAVLTAGLEIKQLLAASIKIDVAQEFPARPWDDSEENEIIWSYNPAAFRIQTGFGPRPVAHPVARPSWVWSKGRLIKQFFSPKWIRAQCIAMKKQGVKARVRVLRRNFGL